MYLKFSFTKWLAGKQAVSFALAIGVIFLITNYQNILHITNPENKDYFNYPFVLRVLLSHIDSLFFGLATAIFIFQSKSETQKILYCIFEAIMVGLNLNRGYLGNDSLFWLSCYIAIFSGFTLYFLGTLAKQHNQNTQQVLPQDEPTPTPQMPITNMFGEPYNAPIQVPAIGFQLNANTNKVGRKPLSSEKITEIKTALAEGKSMRQTAKLCKVSLQKVHEVKHAIIR